MIKFMMEDINSKRTIFGIIIFPENIQLLKQDKPIHFHVEDMPGISKIECDEMLIMYYETLEEALDKLKELGLITEETLTHSVEEPTRH